MQARKQVSDDINATTASLRHLALSIMCFRASLARDTLSRDGLCPVLGATAGGPAPVSAAARHAAGPSGGRGRAGIIGALRSLLDPPHLKMSNASKGSADFPAGAAAAVMDGMDCWPGTCAGAPAAAYPKGSNAKGDGAGAMAAGAGL